VTNKRSNEIGKPASAICTRLYRWRRIEPTLQAACSGRNDPRSKPTEYRYCGHGLASRNIFYVMGVDQEDLEPSRPQDLKQRYPVHSRRFHGYGLDVAPLQPRRSRVQVFRGGRQTTHWLQISIPGTAIQISVAPINTPSTLAAFKVQARQKKRSCLWVALSFPRHWALSGLDLSPRRPGRAG
jgi:hypothetical protein